MFGFSKADKIKKKYKPDLIVSLNYAMPLIEAADQSTLNKNDIIQLFEKEFNQ